MPVSYISMLKHYVSVFYLQLTACPLCWSFILHSWLMYHMLVVKPAKNKQTLSFLKARGHIETFAAFQFCSVQKCWRIGLLSYIILHVCLPLLKFKDLPALWCQWYYCHNFCKSHIAVSSAGKGSPHKQDASSVQVEYVKAE